MALLFMDGFDLSDMAQKWTLASGTVTGSTTTRFSSGRSAAVSGVLRRSCAAASQIFLGASWYWSFQDASDRQWVSFYGDSGATRHITVAQRANTLVIRRGAPDSGTLLATLTGLAINTWYQLQISVTIDDTAGSVVVKDGAGATILSYTGDTRNGGTNLTVDTFEIASTGGATFLFDDLYVCDSSGSSSNTFLGDVRVVSLSPTGAGASTQFTPDTGSNYARVNEVPYSASNYVQSGTTGQRDTYAMADLSGSPTVIAVQNCVVAKKTDAGAMSLKPAIKSGSTVYYGSTTALTVSDLTLTDLRELDPATSAAWTASGVNALEAGAEVA